MTRDEFKNLLDEIQAAEREVRKNGQEEYAHAESNAFRNFEGIAAELGLCREEVLWIYLRKHMDGILAWLKGKRSQREDVRGRIKDARLYLALLWGMVEDSEAKVEHSNWLLPGPRYSDLTAAPTQKG